MNVLVLTSSMLDNHFSIYQEKAKIKPNPSNQNFYSKLIRTLAVENNVSVVTLRPLVKGMFDQKSFGYEEHVLGNITYYYSHVQAGALYKTFSELNDIIKTCKEAIANFAGREFIIITDTLRVNLVKAALKIGKIYNAKVVGVLTDNPFNLSNVNKAYASSLYSLVLECDGYLSLTQKMVDNINPYAPSYVFEGLVENEIPGKRNPITNYFFFSGSLYERYGVKRLVDAYHGSRCANKLVIAGSGPLAKYIDKVASEDSRILYLGQVSREKCISYEMNSLANINPRPLNNKLDKESVPSKMFEYLSMGNPIISTKHPFFYGIFKDNITWIDADQATSIAYALEDFENLKQNELKQKALSAKEKAFEFYGFDVQAELITHFLNKLI